MVLDWDKKYHENTLSSRISYSIYVKFYYQTACAAKRANTKTMLGAFVPTCKDDGTYEEKQCHASTGHCWCVDDNGKEVEGTKKAPGEGEPNCGGKINRF